jgi:hypothetical protein
MSQDTPHRIASNASTITDGKQELVPQNGSNNAPPRNDANQVIVQCLLVAARRGREICLAREQAARLQRSELGAASEETSQSDET